MMNDKFGRRKLAPKPVAQHSDAELVEFAEQYHRGSTRARLTHEILNLRQEVEQLNGYVEFLTKRNNMLKTKIRQERAKTVPESETSENA